MNAIEALELLAFLSALGCGLVAGIFFAFSTFVMKALGKLPAAHGIEAMQSINIVVINPMFMAAFFGTAVLCIAGIVMSLQAGGAALPYMVAGALLYLLGTILVTMAFNVPRNNALAAMSPPTPDAAALWRDYVVTWTAWNTVRTIAALAASALFIVGLVKS